MFEVLTKPRGVDVDYTYPTREKLVKQFDWMCDIFQGWKYQPRFAPMQEFIGIPSEEVKRVEFFVCQICNFAEDGRCVLNQMRERRLRPALFQELLCYDRAYPSNRRDEWKLTAMGSTIYTIGGWTVASIGPGCGHYLFGDSFDVVGVFPSFHRFLVTSA